jgi:hypothetical protein
VRLPARTGQNEPVQTVSELQFFKINQVGLLEGGWAPARVSGFNRPAGASPLRFGLIVCKSRLDLCISQTWNGKMHGGVTDLPLQDARCSPIILHCHIPKTAGISFSNVLYATFRRRYLHHLHSDPAYILTPKILTDLLEVNPLLKSVTSHHLRVFPRRLNGRQPLYITFLREPIATFISLLKYTRREYHKWAPAAQRCWPKDTPRLTLRELARAYLQNVGPDCGYSFQTRFLCSRYSMENAGLSVEDEYGLDRLDIARFILSQFFFVGITEEMRKSLELLAAKLKPFRIELKRPMFLHKNRTRSCEDLSWLNEADEVGQKILQCNESDRQLYQSYRERFLADYARYRKTGVIDTPLNDEPEDQPIGEWAAQQCSPTPQRGVTQIPNEYPVFGSGDCPVAPTVRQIKIASAERQFGPILQAQSPPLGNGDVPSSVE